jgi:nucleoside phosphorylase
VVEHLHIKKEAIIPIFLHLAPLGKMISSEIPVDDEKMLDFWEEEEVFVDMESWGIELVAQHFQYPRLLLKVPIDKVGNATKHFNFEEALETLRKAIDYRNLIENLLKYLPCC